MKDEGSLEPALGNPCDAGRWMAAAVAPAAASTPAKRLAQMFWTSSATA